MKPEQREAAEKEIAQAIKKQLNEQMETYRLENGKSYSPVTVNMYLRQLETWLKWMVDEKHLATLAAPKAVAKMKMTVSEESRRIFYPAQMNKFVIFRPNPHKQNQYRAWAAGILIFDVGIRLESVLSAQLKHF